MIQMRPLMIRFEEPQAVPVRLRNPDGAELAVIERLSVGRGKLKDSACWSSGTGGYRDPVHEIARTLEGIDLAGLGGKRQLELAGDRGNGELGRQRAKDGSRYLGAIVTWIEIGLPGGGSYGVCDHPGDGGAHTQGGSHA